MTVDIRAKVICDLGEIISGGWSDDHVQGSGLIRTRGELVLKGVHRLTLGQPVQLAYVRDNRATRFPRSLRVLSSFADPFRRQTTVQLGCVLTLKENYRGVTKNDTTAYTFNDPANDGIACADFAKGTVSLSAAYVASLCATKLGIQTTGFGVLTNWYTTEEFDLTPGYVQVLGDLLVSESYVGFLDAGEVLQLRPLYGFTGNYTVIEQDQVIDIGSINSGELAASAVSASYSYSRYKEPEERTETVLERVNWEKDTTEGPPEVRRIGNIYTRVVTPTTEVITEYDTFDRAIKRTETTTTHVCATNPSYLKWFIENPSGIIFDLPDTVVTETIFNYLYPAEKLVPPPVPPPAGGCTVLFITGQIYDPERDNQRLSEVRTTYQSEMALAGAVNIAEYSGTILTPLGGSTEWEYHPGLTPDIPTEVVEVRYETDEKSGITKTTTIRQQAQAFTQSGQQIGAIEAEDDVQTGTISEVIERGKTLLNLGSQINTVTDRNFGLQRRPSRSERNNNYDRKEFVEQTSETTFIFGDEESENVVNYQVPYSPDDRIYVDEDGTLRVERGDAEEKAALFGRSQNALAYGHRNGFSLQLAADQIPPYPLDQIALRASSLTGGYIVNGTSWSFDSNGIVCNTDALLVGGIGTQET